MPTKRRRHAVTETPPVEAALDELRGELGTDDVNLSEIVVLGARTKVEALRGAREARMAGRRRLAERIRRGETLVDLAAAEEVRRTGWTPE